MYCTAIWKQLRWFKYVYGIQSKDFQNAMQCVKLMCKRNGKAAEDEIIDSVTVHQESRNELRARNRRDAFGCISINLLLQSSPTSKQER